MFITAHSAVAAAVAVTSGIDQPGGTFVLGWLLHYVGDALPHGDESLGEWARRGRYPAVRMGFMFLIDLVFLVAALAWCWRRGALTPAVWGAVVGSAVPDLLVGAELLLRRPITGFLGVWHEAAHRLIHFVYSPWIGVPLQLVLAALLWRYVGHV